MKELMISKKVAEMDVLIERTQAQRRWLAEAPPYQCRHINDCAAVLSDLPLLKG